MSSCRKGAAPTVVIDLDDIELEYDYSGIGLYDKQDEHEVVIDWEQAQAIADLVEQRKLGLLPVAIDPYEKVTE